MSDITQIGDTIIGRANSVSINGSGNIVAIGEISNNTTKIYKWNGTSWNQLGENIDGEAIYDGSGYSVSLNSVGDIVAIGAPFNDGPDNNNGHTRIFQYNDSDWVQLGQDIDGEKRNNLSGYSVSLNSVGNIVAIGAPFNDGGGGPNRGHTRIFQYNSSSNAWNQLGGDLDGEANKDKSGESVSLNSVGDIVAIGGIGAIGNDDERGHTRIFQYNSSSNAWNQLGGDIDGEAIYDNSGYSVSLNSQGDIVAIGAKRNDGGGFNSGQTRIFQYNSSSNAWNQLGGDIDGEAIYDQSGHSVSLNSQGNIVAIGAPFNDDGGGSNSGQTRIYQYNSSSNAWNQFGGDIDGEAGRDQSGHSVSLNSQGNIVAIGGSNYTKVYELDINLNLDDLINSDVSMVPPVDDLQNDVTYKRIITGNPNIAGFDVQLITVPSNNPSISILNLNAVDLAGQKLNLTGLTGTDRIWIEIEYPNYNPSKNYVFIKYNEVTLQPVTSPDYPVELNSVVGKLNTLGGYLTGLSVIGLNEKSNAKKNVVSKKKYIYLFNNTIGCKRRVLC